MSSVEEIISRMKDACGVKSDIELARYLDLSRSTLISSWKKRGSKPYAYCEIISQKEGVSFDWLLTGQEPKYREQKKLDMDQKELKLLEMINSLSDDHRREILSRIESMHTASQQSKRIEELEYQIEELIKKTS